MGDEDRTSLNLHATSVAFGGRGILLFGPSGSGKSDLALRLIDGGAMLIADDRTIVRRLGGDLLASPPESIAGLIEARGVGILRLPVAGETRLTAFVELVSSVEVERLPEPGFREIMGVSLPLHRLDPFAASAAAKIRFIAEGALVAP